MHKFWLCDELHNTTYAYYTYGILGTLIIQKYTVHTIITIKNCKRWLKSTEKMPYLYKISKKKE